MRDFSGQIEDMKARWMTGGSAETACPDDWRASLGARPNLTLVAMAGQFTRIATVPATGEVIGRAPLPKLALPVIDPALRPLFRRVMDDSSVKAYPVIALLAARGVTAHPADWMPSASTEVPDVYGPWIDWMADAVGASDQDDEITAENWETWTPHGRRVALAELRQRTPAAARELIAAKAGDVPAEQRLRLVGVLEDGLSEDDIGLLETLAQDRSGKVQACAVRMLAWLGKSQDDAAAVAELAAFYERQKAGILSRREVIVACKVKTNAQKSRRLDLAKAVALPAFAGAFGLSADEMIERIVPGEDIEAIIAMVASTGTPAQSARLIARISEQKGFADLDIQALGARLETTDRPTLARQRAASDNSAFQTTRDMLGDTLGVLDIDALKAAPAFATLAKHLLKDDGRVAQYVTQALTNLGLVATAATAETLLDHFTTQSGLMAADPRLALLRLNAALKETP